MDLDELRRQEDRILAPPAVRFRLHWFAVVVLLLPLVVVACVLGVRQPDLSARDWMALVASFLVRWGVIVGGAWLAGYVSFRALRRSNATGNVGFCGNAVVLMAAIATYAPLTLPAERRSLVLERMLAALHEARPRLPVVTGVDGDLRRDLDATLQVIRAQVRCDNEHDERLLQTFSRLAESQADRIARHREAYRAFVQAGGLDPRTLMDRRACDERRRLLAQVNCARLAELVRDTPEGVRRALVSSGAQVDRVAQSLVRFDALLQERAVAELMDGAEVVRLTAIFLSDLEHYQGQWTYDAERDRIECRMQAELDHLYQMVKTRLERPGLIPGGLYEFLIPS